MQHIRDVVGPPEIGRFYLVPTATGYWRGRFRELPVLGPKHNDKQDLQFEPMHFHIDARFVNATRAWDFWQTVAAQPVSDRDTDGTPRSLAGPYDRKWRCKRLASPWQDAFIEKALGFSGWCKHFDRWAGQTAPHDGQGWVCPHRQVALKDQPVGDDGVIVCPLHNLHICNATGRVLTRDEMAARLDRRASS